LVTDYGPPSSCPVHASVPGRSAQLRWQAVQVHCQRTSGVDHDAVTVEGFFKAGVTRSPNSAPVEGEWRDRPAPPSGAPCGEHRRRARAAP
jgi:hypothetical protein